METQKISSPHKKKIADGEGGQALQHTAHRGCGVSITGDIQHRTGQCPEQLERCHRVLSVHSYKRPDRGHAAGTLEAQAGIQGKLTRLEKGADSQCLQVNNGKGSSSPGLK